MEGLSRTLTGRVKAGQFTVIRYFQELMLVVQFGLMF
jgi:hypothetical protein